MNYCVCQINAPSRKQWSVAEIMLKGNLMWSVKSFWTMKSSFLKQSWSLRPLSSLTLLAHFVILIRSASFVMYFLVSPCARPRTSSGWTLNNRCIHVGHRCPASSAEVKLEQGHWPLKGLGKAGGKWARDICKKSSWAQSGCYFVPGSTAELPEQTVRVQNEPRTRQCLGHCGRVTSLLGNTHQPPLCPGKAGGCHHLSHPPAFDVPLHQSLSSVFGWMEPVAVLRPELQERLGEGGPGIFSFCRGKGPPNSGRGLDIGPLELSLLMITRAEAIISCHPSWIF